MTTDMQPDSARWQNWLSAALIRAIAIERDAAEAHNELTTYKPRKQRPMRAAEAGAVENWYEQTHYPVQDPPNFIENWNARQAKPAKPTKLFRSFHGKKESTHAA